MKNNITTETKNESRSAEDIMQDHSAAGNDPDDFSRFLAYDNIPDEVATPILTTVQAIKPPNDAFIRTHPDTEARWAKVMMLHLKSKGRNEQYLLLPMVAVQLAAGELGQGRESTMSEFRLVQYTDRTGENRIWPIKWIDNDNEWLKSAKAAAKVALEEWIRVISDRDKGRYVVQRAIYNDVEPRWREEPFIELVKLAYQDKTIEDLDHPVIQELRGGKGA